MPRCSRPRSWSRRLVGLTAAALLGAGALTFAPADAATAATGPDVSNYQHPKGAPIDWTQVRAAGHSFAFIKATEGPSGVGGYYTNPWFATDWQQAGSAGLLRGAYHFARPQLPLDSAIQQARYFVSVTGTMRAPVDLPPVLDLESNGGLAPADLIAWTKAWLDEVERLTGRRPIIYTGYYFWKDSMASSTAFGGYRLWMARYASSPFPLPTSWETWTFWQWTSSASVPGIQGAVDMNDYCCPDANLYGLAGPGATNPAAGNPFGNLEVPVRLPGAIRFTGWAIDPDTRSPLDVHVYIDGVGATATRAEAQRPDLAAAYPGWGTNHGIDVTIPVPAGEHRVCAYAINTGSGNANTNLGCHTVVSNPIGAYDLAFSDGPGRARVQGWAIDPDADTPIPVHVYVDGVGRAAATADLSRPDLPLVFPGAGPNHGYDVTVSALATGWHNVCVYAINYNGGNANPLLGCRWVNALPSTPVGNVDVVAGGAGSVVVQGWTFDPDTAAPTQAHVYVDGVGRAALTADGARADVAAAYPGFGANHGFSGRISGVTPGRHQVCTYGINVGPGQNVLLGCRSVTVPTGPPIGNIDTLAARPTTITARGWALDPDQVGPIEVELTVDGGAPVKVTADLDRGDIGAAFPALGPLHGYEVTLTGIGGGAHEVCARAVDPAGGPGVPLGCKSVVSPAEPIGTVEAASRTAEDTAQISGWALDPDTADPVAIHVYVDGTGVMDTVASIERPDVADHYPGYGPGRGWSVSVVGLTGNAHTVCVYALNVGPGSENTNLGCSEV